MAAAPVLGAVLSIAQAGAAYGAAKQQANEQNAYYERNRVAAIAAANDKYASLNNNTIQEREAATQNLIQKRIEALKAKSKAAVAAGEGGVTGLSVDAMLNDFEAQEGRSLEAIHTNYDIKKWHNYDEGVATYHQTWARIQSVRQASSPSAAPFILQGLGGALGAFSRGGSQPSVGAVNFG